MTLAIVSYALLMCLAIETSVKERLQGEKEYKVEAIIIAGDTIPVVNLPEVVISSQEIKNK